MDPRSGAPRPARLRTRLLSLVYEALILLALLLVATAVFTAVFGDSRAQPARTLLQSYLLLVAATYFVWSWTGGRRTLPMRTWRMRLLDASGHPPPVRVALLRYFAAVVSGALYPGAATKAFSSLPSSVFQMRISPS